ncbi:sushi, von Willebrand factor type A, EGF and pentraxin domain-containing protein 1-like, partial [Ruditapes philippinarum]|uniref:sushi, von Willebrand factor type A, EGF and pentraxin domain-containing protein 1-like n=1 Tax=Ruditapes philippinarum TaxID=129788 RepID=UPI00295B8648
MADPNSEEFKDVENEFCSQLNENARDSGVAKGFNYHGCAVTEIKSGSLIIRYVIIIRTVNAAPSAAEVSAVINIQIDVDEQTVGVFVVVNFSIVTETPKVITSDQNPAIIAKQFNETCTVVKKERCVTRHSQCLDGMCKCPVGRTYNTTSDSCTTIDCGNEYAIANGNATSNGTQYNSFLNISCDDGFELSTNETGILCTSPSSWTDLPICMPVECPEFIKPANSEIDSNSSGRIYRDVIKITCDTGYQFDGNLSSVECFANQSWSESPVCQIVTCQTFETPDNAAITPDLQQFDYDANVSVLCNIGFDIQGENNVTCLANGTWTDIPKCVTLECDHLAIANATFEPTNQPYQYLDNVTVNCNDGYILEGNNTITCTTNGSWSELPTCMPINCDHLELTSAIFEPSEQPYQYLDNITVDCNDGYTLEGNNTVSCTMNGTWSGLPACTPIDCDLLNITDAIFEPSVQPYTYLDNVTVDCTDGYILEGSKTVSCKSNGTWSELPTCMPMNCDPLEITNAFFEPSEQPYQYLDNITVDCNDGFTLEGNNTVSCMTNGTWSGLPACTPIDCDLLNIADAIFEPSVQPYKYLDNVTVDCTDGYILEGSNTVSCKANGTWSELPTCIQINCDPLEITNAFFSPNKSQFLYGENVTVGCELGFQIQGTNVLSCQTDGSWKEAPTCDAIVCKLFNLSENIKIISEDKSIYSYNEHVTLDCENGYVINGNATVKCQGDASWAELPTCRAINCSDFELPSMAINNSKLNDLTFDDSVYITCESGFVLVGDSNITCKADGTWPTIACVEANCSAEDFSKPNNSRVSTTSESGTVFEFECVEGYNLEGNSSVSCISGNWSSFPSCELVDCGSYGLVDNGNVSPGTGTKYDDTVDIACLENFKLIGKSQGICLQNGSWTEKPVCMRLECQKFIVPENAIIPENINETAVGTNISLVCIGGYDLVGAEIVMCKGNETWSEIPDCKLKDCGPPNNINNSKLTGLDKTTFNSTFTVECEDGYNLKGESILQCQINGSWTKYPSCEIKDCGEIGELGNGTIVKQTGTLFGSTAHAICNDGYGLVGKENLTCTANGEWDVLPICIKSECGVYTPPDNAIPVFGSDYNISCKEGYELIGEATIECLNGNWSGNGTCKRIQCKTLPQIDNADVEPDSGNYFGDTLNVSCKLGFELSNSLKAECDSNKTWINVPTCNPISCGNYSLPPYSEISEISTTTGVFEDTINITCSTGFDIEGENYVICNATGEWENDPVCIPKACGKFETPDHATVPDDTNLDGFTYNQSITVTCDTGYNISGNSVVLCGADAKWDSSPLCLPVNCPVLTLDDNTFIDRNETNFVYNDSVEISC